MEREHAQNEIETSDLSDSEMLQVVEDAFDEHCEAIHLGAMCVHEGGQNVQCVVHFGRHTTTNVGHQCAYHLLCLMIILAVHKEFINFSDLFAVDVEGGEEVVIE